MEILPEIEIVDLGLYLVKEKTLIFSDFHLGYEEALNKQGVFIPRHQFLDTMNRLKHIFDKLKAQNKRVDTIIVTGDLKHEFGAISSQEWRDVSDLLNLFEKNCKKIILIKGNHDTVLQSVIKKKGLQVKSYYCFDNFAVLHGDSLPSDASILKQKIFIIGHEHPAIKLTDSIISEKVKCFLKGNWNNKLLIVLPSFNLVTEGTNVLSEKLLSPFLHQDLSNFEAFAVAGYEKILYFGKLKNLV